MTTSHRFPCRNRTGDCTGEPDTPVRVRRAAHTAADDGKHALSVIGVDSRLLEPKGREVWREGGEIKQTAVWIPESTRIALALRAERW